MGRKSKYTTELRARAVRLVFEQREQHDSEWAAIQSIAAKVGCLGETLRQWCATPGGARFWQARRVDDE